MIAVLRESACRAGNTVLRTSITDKGALKQLGALLDLIFRALRCIADLIAVGTAFLSAVLVPAPTHDMAVGHMHACERGLSPFNNPCAVPLDFPVDGGIRPAELLCYLVDRDILVQAVLDLHPFIKGQMLVLVRHINRLL